VVKQWLKALEKQARGRVDKAGIGHLFVFGPENTLEHKRLSQSGRYRT
jgi:hypothetical protein